MFQVRGFDIGNITFIEGDTGLIALDGLTVHETAAAALALLETLLQQQLLPMQAVDDGRVKIASNALLLTTFFGLLDRFAGSFPVVDAAPGPPDVVNAQAKPQWPASVTRQPRRGLDGNSVAHVEMLRE